MRNFKIFGLACLVAALGLVLMGDSSVVMAAQSVPVDIHSYFSEMAGAGMALAGLGRIKLLRDKKAGLLKEAEAINARIDAGEASDEDIARLEAITDDDGDLDKVSKSITREQKLMDEKRSMAAITGVNDDTDEEADDKVPAQAKKETEGFASFGEQMQAIAYAGQKGISRDEWDRRLTGLYMPGGIQGASGANEAVPNEGGFLVQQDLAAPMLETMFETGAILPQVRRVPIGANSNGLVIPAIDETSRANGSRHGGVQAYWADEADTVNGSKPKFRNMDMRLKKLMAIGYATEELLADSSALGSIMSMAFTDELVFKTEDAIINGTGSGQPLGILNSGALISVAKESGQAADTVVTQNVLNMFSRLTPRSTTRAVWLINQNVLPQLWNLTIGSGTSVALLYRPPGVDGPNTNAPGGTLLGRPVIPVEYSASVGDVGDITLVDLDQYLMIDKGGIKQNASMHVRFLYDEMTFRFTYRVDGQPMQRVATTPYKGTASTLSPYVALAARA